MTRLARLTHHRPSISYRAAFNFFLNVTVSPGCRRQGADSTTITEGFPRRKARGSQPAKWDGPAGYASMYYFSPADRFPKVDRGRRQAQNGLQDMVGIGKVDEPNLGQQRRPGHGT